MAELVKLGGKLTINREETLEDATHRRRKDWWLFLAAIAAIATVTLVALVGAFGPWASAVQQEIAQTLLTALIGAFAGFVVGRKSAD